MAKTKQGCSFCLCSGLSSPTGRYYGYRRCHLLFMTSVTSYFPLKKWGKAMRNAAKLAIIAPIPMHLGLCTRLPKKLTNTIRTVFPTCRHKNRLTFTVHKSISFKITLLSSLIIRSHKKTCITGWNIWSDIFNRFVTTGHSGGGHIVIRIVATTRTFSILKFYPFQFVCFSETASLAC